MDYVKELFEKYEIRKSKKEKTEFIEWVKEIAIRNDWDVEIQKGDMGARNIVMGNPDEASVIFTAHYDTCANMIVPNFITPKNIWIYLIYQILLCLVIFIPAVLVGVIAGVLFPDYIEITSMLSSLILLVILILMMVGPANKHTANDNTSGVATVLGLLSKFNPKNDKVALILFDLEEVGLVGSSSFASKHKNIAKNTLLVNYDCVSDGETMLFVLNKRTKDLMGTFEESFKSNDKVTSDIVYKGVFYPSDQVAFKKGIGVCAMKKNKFFKSGYVDRIHTIRDTVFRKENIEFLVDGSYKLYKNLSK